MYISRKRSIYYIYVIVKLQPKQSNSQAKGSFFTVEKCEELLGPDVEYFASQKSQCTCLLHGRWMRLESLTFHGHANNDL